MEPEMSFWQIVGGATVSLAAVIICILVGAGVLSPWFLL